MAVMRIKEYRKRSGLTQASMAGTMGVTQSIISDWENEVYLPKSRDLPLLAKVLGCEINELFVQDGAEAEPQ